MKMGSHWPLPNKPGNLSTKDAGPSEFFQVVTRIRAPHKEYPYSLILLLRLGTRTLLVAPGLATRNKKLLVV